jgi:hypothetical protein
LGELFALCCGFRRPFFGRRQLQIGREQFRILDKCGRVSLEMPYAIMASIALVKKSVAEERTPEFFNPLSPTDWVVFGAKESLRGIESSTPMKEVAFLGIRYLDGPPAALDRQDVAEIAAVRGSKNGYDWMMGPDLFAAPLAVIGEKIQARWLAYGAAVMAGST